ncbi:acyltransferase [Streptomyces capparidis]
MREPLNGPRPPSARPRRPRVPRPRPRLRLPRLRAWARRIDAATPPGRDRAVDGLRAFAVLGVVLGHWLVTAVVDEGGGRLAGASPLRSMPYLAPVSWMCQTLALFFFVGGYAAVRGRAAARARGAGCPVWLRGRLRRLLRPVPALLAVWGVATVAFLVGGAEYRTARTVLRLVVSPLWFLLVFAALTAATPLVARLHPAWPLAAVALVDLVRFRLDGPQWTGWVNVAAGWLVPYCLGARWARGGFAGRRSGLGLLVCGGLATAALVVWGGYPASMVGVPGAEVSNLNPPTLAAVTFGLAQCGLALRLRGPLRRALARPAAWAAVAAVNLSAMTVFLWHQTAMLAVTATTLPLGPLPGLHTHPGGPDWVAARLPWLAAFAAVLLVCRAAFHGRETGARRTPAGDAPRPPGAAGPAGVVPESYSRITAAGDDGDRGPSLGLAG